MASSHSVARLRPLLSRTRLRPFAATGGYLCPPSVALRIGTRPPLATITFRARWQSNGPAAPPSAGGANDYTLGPANTVQPQPNTQIFGEETKGKKKDGSEGGAGEGGGRGRDSGGGGGKWSNVRPAETAWKMFESAATTAASLFVLG